MSLSERVAGLVEDLLDYIDMSDLDNIDKEMKRTKALFAHELESRVFPSLIRMGMKHVGGDVAALQDLTGLSRVKMALSLEMEDSVDLGDNCMTWEEVTAPLPKVEPQHLLPKWVPWAERVYRIYAEETRSAYFCVRNYAKLGDDAVSPYARRLYRRLNKGALNRDGRSTPSGIQWCPPHWPTGLDLPALAPVRTLWHGRPFP